MGCLFLLIAALSPRLALILTWIFTPWVDRATGAFIWPLLGLHLSSDHHAALCDPVEYGRIRGRGMGVDPRHSRRLR